jgi:hypothetical protein
MIDIKSTLTAGGQVSLKRIGTTVALTVTCQDEHEAENLFGAMMKSLRAEGKVELAFEDLDDQRYQGERLQ